MNLRDCFAGARRLSLRLGNQKGSRHAILFVVEQSGALTTGVGVHSIFELAAKSRKARGPVAQKDRALGYQP